ncbi:pilus assembly protein [Endozoicomonas sp. ISHI1]|uniref:pilus assembly protein n=3 Tax=unclassified Endozoicomonas TaxID=2644528 RepID=UPI0021477A2E|nr:PilC/PilY family type IV pilus protein [Endozoicomonas sp. ISHI1]
MKHRLLSIPALCLMCLSEAWSDDTDLLINGFNNGQVDFLGFAAPASVGDAANSLQNSDELYYILLWMINGPGWRGNLKRYSLGTDNQVYDANGHLAIDSSTGFFTGSSRSFWGNTNDGNSATSGGMAAHLKKSRTVVSNITGSNSANLNASGNRVTENNAGITTGILGLSGSAAATNRTNVLKWARGVDVDDEDGDGSTTDNRTSTGDPLHTQPKVITYYKNSAGSVVDRTVYFTTNDGFLHAVNTDNGSTEFSFIPKELLVNLKIYKDNLVQGADHYTGPSSDEGCVWNFRIPGSCIPEYWCSFQYQLFDIHPSQSCRLNAPRTDGDCDYNIFAPPGTCHNPEFCEYRYRFGDLNLNQSCRLRSRPQIPPPTVNNTPVKLYGMDGPMTVWINDANGDGDVLQSNNGFPDSGEHVNLYLTMRRGGSNIYALDVIRRYNPELRWVIRGDQDRNNQADSTTLNPDFPELGQTWSAPTPAKVRFNGADRQVLLFGAGYDQDADEQTTIGHNDIGRGIYMVDASTGQKLWSAGNSGTDLDLTDMNYSIPADLAVIDIDRDGLTDYFFAVDIGGQVWRFDVNQSNTGASDFATGGRIANFSGSTQADARRFYEKPDVSLSRSLDHLNIVVGSGFRAKPLDTQVDDRLYVIRDPNIYNAPVSYDYHNGSVIDESALYDATANLVQQGNGGQRAAALNALDSQKGWYIRFEVSGEKLLGRPTVFNNVLTFTTYAPGGGGSSFLYVLNIDNAGAVLDLDGNSQVVKGDRKRQLRYSILTPAPVILNRGSQGADICVGGECFQDILREAGSIPFHKTFWRENQ